MSEVATTADQQATTADGGIGVVWFNDPELFEDEPKWFDDPVWCEGLAEHPREAKKRLMASGDWLGPAGAKVLYVLGRVRFDALLNVDERYPFRKRVLQSHAANCKAFDSDQVEQGPPSNRCECLEGTKPFLQKSVVYHAYRKLGLWEAASPARVAFVRRLESEGSSSNRANELSWRLLEDLLFWSDRPEGFSTERIQVEINAMLIFGQERKRFDPVTHTEEELAAWKSEIGLLRKLFTASAVGWLPTTVMHAHQLFGTWESAARLLQRCDPDRGELGNHSTSGCWQQLGYWFLTHRQHKELRESIQKVIRQYDERHNPK